MVLIGFGRQGHGFTRSEHPNDFPARRSRCADPTTFVQEGIARPWRKDLKLGGVEIDNGIEIVLKADEPYKGKIVFDIPRYKEYMGFKKDWPRMNTMPEWFTVEKMSKYKVKRPDGSQKIISGKELSEGMNVEIKANKEIRLFVTRD